MHALHGNGSPDPNPAQPVTNIFQVSLATGGLSRTNLVQSSSYVGSDSTPADPCPDPDPDPDPNPDPSPPHTQPHSRTQSKRNHKPTLLQRQVSFRLHNVCGFRDDTFRKSYLRHATCDVLACLETNCASAEEEVTWAKDWHGQSFWASQYRDPSSQSLSSHRGVAIFLHGNHCSTGRVTARDPDGRFLAVYVSIYSRPSLIIAIHTDCGSGQAASLERALDAITATKPAGSLDIHLMIDTNNHTDPLDYHRFAYSLNDPTLDNSPYGANALGNLTLVLGGLCDAYRALHPDVQEFTYTHYDNGAVFSKSRIDRHYLPPTFLSGSAPRLVSVTHLPPTGHALRRSRGFTSHQDKCGDHAAVCTVIAYSDTPKPPPTWHLPLHLLKRSVTANQLRDVAYSSLTRNQHMQPCQRMRAMLADTRKWAREQTDASSRAHRQLTDDVMTELHTCESMLGKGVGLTYHISGICDPLVRLAAHTEYVRRHNAALARLDNLKAREDRRWILDHDYDRDIYDETCRREFFSRQRALNHTDSFIQKLTVAPSETNLPNRTFTKQAQLNEAASRFYGSVEGGLFNLPITDDPTAEATLFAALRADNKVLPAEHSERLSSFESIICLRTVRDAISGMSNGSSPGLDGFPTEFFKLFVLRKPNASPDDDDPFGDLADEDDDDGPGAAQRAQARRVIQLLVDCYKECLTNPTPSLPTEWNVSVTSLIHKKGLRDLLSNYRPISVCPVLYKILARCISDALKVALPWVISDFQVACQEGKSCYSNCRYMQDLEHYCDHHNLPGFFLFADATKAFDRVNQAYLMRVMTHMRLPLAFRNLFSLLLTNATTRVKVNGYMGCPITLMNGVRQGDPCAAAAFILSLQPFLSLLTLCSRVPTPIPLANGSTRTVKLEGISIPAPDGSTTHPVTCIAAAMADDVGLCLRDTLQLDPFKPILAVHERASNALNNWPKTFGHRVGSLRGSSEMPAGWNPQHINFSTDPAIRYLGNFFGPESSVRAEWIKPDGPSDNSNPTDLTSRMSHRLAQWASLGVGRTYQGRNLVIKNSVLAMAWYLTETQTIPKLDAVLTTWQHLAWNFVESSSSSLKSIGTQTRTAHHVARIILVQDYPEGGRRCLDVELFVRALRARVVRSLLEPNAHPYKNLAFYWIRRSYPLYPFHPRYLLLSNCDFAHLHHDTPQFWREVLVSWGSLGNGLLPSDPSPPPSDPPTLQPTYQESCPRAPLDDGVWHRSSTRRAGSAHTFTFPQLISMPIAHNPHLAGCLGAPVRDPIARSAARHSRDKATRVQLIRPPSQTTIDSSHELHKRLTRLTTRGITLIADLLTGLEPHSALRFKSVSELADTGRLTRSDPPIPRYLCEELLACISDAMHSVIAEAAALWASNPSLTLASLCLLLPLPKDTWVRHVATSHIHTTIDSTRGSSTSPTTYTLSPPLAVRPDGRLARVESPSHLPILQPLTSIHARDLQQVCVWRSTSVAHNEEKREFESRNPQSIRTVLFLGGEATDRYYLHRDPAAPPPVLDPTLLTLPYNPTDRMRPPITIANLDVYSLYHLQLSYRHVIPRTLDSSIPASATSTSLSHLLVNDGATQSVTRRSICKQSHPDPMHGHLTAHHLYMTVNDARPLGNARCRKVGPTHMYCDICWHVDRVLRRELSSHVCVDCPYTRLVIDPLLRSLLSLYAPDQTTRDHWTTCTSAYLTDAFECLLHTGSSIGCPIPIPPLVAANFAGCLQQALFERAERNAPKQSLIPPRPSSSPDPATNVNHAPHPYSTARYPDHALSFDPRPCYAHVISLLASRLSHTRGFASDEDDNLARLHPGIEPWLADHGNLFDWHKEWDPLTHPQYPLALPLTLDEAPVGSTGAMGVNHLRLLVLPRLSVISLSGSQTLHVSLRLSIGRRVGDIIDDVHQPADPDDDAWPLAAGSHPEYPIDCIIDERVSTRRGVQFRVKWCCTSHVTSWEPASSLADTAALAAWLVRPRGAFTVALRGDPVLLDAVLALPHLPPTRLSNLTSLRASMDPHGVIPLEPTYPNSTGGVTGGRTVYYDAEGKGNIFLTCHEMIRAYVFGEYYDEVDMSRSHITSVLGCWSLTGRPSTLTGTRMLADQAELEADIALDLSLMRTTFEAELAMYVGAAGTSPTPDQTKRVVYARKALEKCHMAPKQVFSAMVNCRNPNSWRIPFPSSTCPALTACLNDALLMRSSVALHPLCAPLAQALTSTGVLEYRVISICLGHLDTQALQAARESLTAVDCPTGPTINDSLLISARSPAERHSILTRVTRAASSHLGYPVTFKYLPNLTKPDKPRPDLVSIATALHLSPPPSLSDLSPACPSPQTSRSPSPLPPCHPSTSLPHLAASSDSNLAPSHSPPPPLMPTSQATPAHNRSNPDSNPPSPLLSHDSPDIVNVDDPLSLHSSLTPQLSHPLAPEPITSPYPSESPASTPIQPPQPSQPHTRPRCSLCTEPLGPADIYDCINFFREECPHDHTLCAACATLYPHACTLDMHACVLCSDPIHPPPPPSPNPYTHCYPQPPPPPLASLPCPSLPPSSPLPPHPHPRPPSPLLSPSSSLASLRSHAPSRKRTPSPIPSSTSPSHSRSHWGWLGGR